MADAHVFAFVAEQFEISESTLKEALDIGNPPLGAIGNLVLKDVSSGGRPPGMTAETKARIRVAAAFSRCRLSQRKMAPYLYPKNSQENTYRFFSDYRQKIAEVKAEMTDSEAQQIVREYTQTPSQNH